MYSNSKRKLLWLFAKHLVRSARTLFHREQTDGKVRGIETLGVIELVHKLLWSLVWHKFAIPSECFMERFETIQNALVIWIDSCKHHSHDFVSFCVMQFLWTTSSWTLFSIVWFVQSTADFVRKNSFPLDTRRKIYNYASCSFLVIWFWKLFIPHCLKRESYIFNVKLHFSYHSRKNHSVLPCS